MRSIVMLPGGISRLGQLPRLFSMTSSMQNNRPDLCYLFNARFRQCMCFADVVQTPLPRKTRRGCGIAAQQRQSQRDALLRKSFEKKKTHSDSGFPARRRCACGSPRSVLLCALFLPAISFWLGLLLLMRPCLLVTAFLLLVWCAVACTLSRCRACPLLPGVGPPPSVPLGELRPKPFWGRAWFPICFLGSRSLVRTLVTVTPCVVHLALGHIVLLNGQITSTRPRENYSLLLNSSCKSF
jgi:hypothetical protein